jgi:hypothetical protein
MKSNKRFIIFLFLAFMMGCGGGGGGSGPAVTLSSIAVTPGSPTISSGQSEQFTATGTFSNGSTQDLTSQVTWSSGTPSVAQISASGLATAASIAGQTAITASLSGINSNTATLTVSLATLSSIAVTPTGQSIESGGTLQFTATGTFSDNSTRNITSQVTWTSTGAVSETISAAGLLTATTVGSTTVTATLSGKSGSATLTVTVPDTSNVMTITVNGALCDPNTSAGYPNKPCVQVTLCDPNTLACQTINDVLLDTGSYGFRVFKSVLTLPLQQVASGTGSLAECVQFADFSSLWGPVMLANIKLGNEPQVQVPIQVVDASFAAIPSSSRCAPFTDTSGITHTTDQTPSDAGFAGILGVGPRGPDGGLYYSCTGASCSPASTANQVTNPVSLLPQDNNGVIVHLPVVLPGGTNTATGSLILGINTATHTNNVLSTSSATILPTDNSGDLDTNNGLQNGFLDTGSNGIFFAGSLTLCSSNPNDPLSSWFCPASLTTLSATNAGISGTNSTTFNYQIGNFLSLTSVASDKVFVELGGPSNFGFDWGLPFFYGRSVFVGMTGKSANLSTLPNVNGPFVAY